MTQRHLIDGAIGVLVLIGVLWTLTRPRVQQSERYQATVVPLANIMDVGFLVMSPIIVALVGYKAPLYMLGICFVAIAAGFCISYNISHSESELPRRGLAIENIANWSLFGASMVNIAYYTMLLMTLILLPLQIYTEDRVTVLAVALLVAVTVAGYRGYLPQLNRLGDRTTAFNLAAIFAVLAAFAAYNVHEWLGGNFDFPTFEPEVDSDTVRKIVGLFAMVQGFEASRYIGERFSAGVRISSMRTAQAIATTVFVALIALALLPGGQVKPNADAKAIFVVSDHVSPYLPWLILAAALGSQLSAITNATSSRSDLLLQATRQKLPRKYTFPILLVPAMMIVVFANVTDAVAIASRIFAVYFVLQAVVACIHARVAKAWLPLVGFAGVGLVMSGVAIFGLPL